MKVGVVVARFQTPYLHKGHVNLLNHVKENSDRMVVVLGVAPVLSTRDPLPFALRQRMVRQSYPEAVLWGLGNYRHDRDWAHALDAFLYTAFPRAKITLYGCRDSCLEIYAKFGYNEIQNLGEFQDVGTVSASNIRASVKEIDNQDFLRGVIYGVNSVCPRVLPAVDIAFYQKPPACIAALRVLLVRKQSEAEWRFPGGCVDPEDDNLEFAARRELIEETGLSCNLLTYVSARRIDDWRFRNTGISVFSTFYAAQYIHGFAKPQDREIADTKWCVVNEAVMEVSLVDEHRPLYLDFLKFAKDKGLL